MSKTNREVTHTFNSPLLGFDTVPVFIEIHVLFESDDDTQPTGVAYVAIGIQIMGRWLVSRFYWTWMLPSI